MDKAELINLEPDDEHLALKCTRVSLALCRFTYSSPEIKSWQERDRKWVAYVLMHTVTSPKIASAQRTVKTVHELVTAGDVSKIDPFLSLMSDMEKNTTYGGTISLAATKMMKTRRQTPKQFESIVLLARDALDWVQGDNIEAMLLANLEDYTPGS